MRQAFFHTDEIGEFDMRGRRPDPVLKLLSSARRQPDAGASRSLPEIEPPVPPSDLSADQRQAWDHAIASAPAGLLGPLDKFLLCAWVVAVVELRQAEGILGTEGMVVLDGAGRRRLSPWIRIRRDAYERMMKASAELGFRPLSRRRLKVGSVKDSGNRFHRGPAADD